MANFRTHLGGGAALGAAVGTAAVLQGLTGGDAGGLALMLVLAALVGSVAPDIDSDSSVPFHVTFGILSLIAGAAAVAYAAKAFPGDWQTAAVYAFTAAFVVWVVIGSAFKKFTRHRGMVHSIPAAALGTLLIFLCAARLGLPDWHAFLVSVSFCLGYLLHLMLDELFAAVSFHGLTVGPKQSFGSALKLFSKSHPVNFAVYVAIAAIVFTNQDRLAPLLERLAEFV